MSDAIVPPGRIDSPAELRERLAALRIDLALDAAIEPGGPLAQPLRIGGRAVGNRFAVLPMEGWDGTRDGFPTELVERRWRRFGASGAKLIWGGEAVAVRYDGRANANQLVLTPETAPAIASLRRALVDEHERTHGSSDDLLVGLQLTHSGRWSRPDGAPAPRIAYHHPYLDRRVGAESIEPLTDDDLGTLADDFVAAAVLAAEAGFGFVDVKHCHGYLLHELLSARDRPGPYGGSFEHRTRFARDVIVRIRAAAPSLLIGVRLSVFDMPPYRPGDDRIGISEAAAAYPYAFGGDGRGGIDLDEPSRFIAMLAEAGVSMICVTAGSPYSNPHIQRPAFYPPSDGYLPPEDPLAGVARQIAATAEMKRRHPDVAFVGSAYSYLQEWLPHVAQRQVREGAVDIVGLGRSMLSYPTLPADVLTGRTPDRKQLCRTFSDCTTAPRNGMISGCYPLDSFYKTREERTRLAAIKKG